ncbi:MAG: sensor histidine kinase [Gloeocapsa sp. DLM2.Bin57]|nr:MAG: sensor histidine kinase [Gloeocapsa sp. DLM2.Bin57]
MNWETLDVELVYIQDKLGKYISFYWQKGKDIDLVDEIAGKHCQEIFVPVAINSYLERLNRVIDSKIAEQCQWEFQHQQQSWLFALTMTPILKTQGRVEEVLVMGYLVTRETTNLTGYKLIPVSLEPYQEMLNQISNKIRKTLDLQTIWQETVDSLGKKLDVSRCLLIYCDGQNQELEVKAEFCKPPFRSVLGKRFNLDSQSYWRQAISAKEPVIIQEINNNIFGEKSVLILSTFYQDQRNGLICLQQNDYCRQWSQIEVDLLNKLADQVGTAIAHATLYQELEKISRYKSNFLANTSHELRTPIHVIINSVDFILDGIVTEPEQQREFLEKISQSSRHLLKIIDDLLDIHKIESGRMSLEFKTIPLSELLQSVEKLMRPQAESKKITLKIKYPATYEEVILYSNYQRLFQVMLNLLSNAIKFTHKGGVYIIAEVISKKVTFKDEQFPGVVKISVSDTGIGVPLHKQDELFEQFFQVDNSPTKFYPGTGLGLAISKTFVKALGGTISFYSMGEGLGSTVTFTVLLHHLPLLKTIRTNLSEVDDYI